MIYKTLNYDNRYYQTDDEYRRDLVVSKVNLLTKSMEEYINIFSDTIEIINLHDNYWIKNNDTFISSLYLMNMQSCVYRVHKPECWAMLERVIHSLS
jgi:hypothetical protein